MALYYLSKAENMEVGKRHKKTSEEKAERKEHRKEGFHKVLKVAEAPARGAFLVLLKLNALKLATHMLKAYKQNPDKVLDFWKKFKGDPDKLKEAIAHGAKGTLNGLSEISLGGEMVQVGIALEAAIASATPIIIKVMDLLKSMKIISPKEETDLKEAAEQGAKQLEKDVDQGADHVEDVSDKASKKKKGFFSWIKNLFNKEG